MAINPNESSYGGEPVAEWLRRAYEFLRSSQGGAPASEEKLLRPDYGTTKMGPDLTPTPSPSPSRPLPPYPPSVRPPQPAIRPTRPMSVPDLLVSHVPSMTTTPEPESPLKFAWGGGTPQAYIPGQTDIARAAEAPPSDTFMGRITRPGGGTLSVLNPPAVKDEDTLAEEYFRSRLERNIQDPFWEEREKAKIWRDAQIGAQSGLYDMRAKQIQRWGEDQKAAIDNDPVSTPEAKVKSRKEIDDNVKQMLNELYGSQGSGAVKSPGNFPKI